jgi:cytochrome P450
VSRWKRVAAGIEIMNNASSENDGLPHFSPQDLDSKLKLWCTTVAAVVTALAVYFFATRQSEKKYQYPLPPYCTCGFFETLQSFNSTKFHEWVLNLTRTQGRILEINLWPLVPAGVHFFQVNDPKVARKILENPKALKAREGYEFFDRLVGGICFISEEGERYKHPRKSTLMGMSHSNVDNMISKINDVMDKWIADNLGKNKGDVVDVDIGVEMQKATVYSIGKIAFGYDFSKEEQEETLNKLMKTTYEFGIACEQNPLRKNPILGLLWADKREATGFVQDLRFLLRKVLETHRKKCVAEQKKAVALDEMDKPEKYEAFDGDEGLISDMLLLYAAGFDTSKSLWWHRQFSLHWFPDTF